MSCTGADCPVTDECAEACAHLCHHPAVAFRVTALGRPVTETPIGVTCRGFRWSAVVHFEQLSVPGATPCGNCGAPVGECGFDPVLRQRGEDRVRDDACDRRAEFPDDPPPQMAPRVWP